MEDEDDDADDGQEMNAFEGNLIHEQQLNHLQGISIYFLSFLSLIYLFNRTNKEYSTTFIIGCK